MRCTFLVISALIVVAMSFPSNSQPEIKPAEDLVKVDHILQKRAAEDVAVMEEETAELDEELGHSVEKRDAEDEDEDDDEAVDDEEDDEEDEDDDDDDEDDEEDEDDDDEDDEEDEDG